MAFGNAVRRLCARIAARRPARVIEDEGHGPYLRRFFLMKLGPLHVYLHHFVGSDPDRGLHDHPWQYAGTFLLAGSYFEEVMASPFDARADIIARHAPCHRLIRGHDFHRVVLYPNHIAAGGTWSLFWHLSYVKGWGFRRTDGVVRGNGGVPDAVLVTMVPHKIRPSGRGGWWRTAPKGREMFADLGAPSRKGGQNAQA